MKRPMRMQGEEFNIQANGVEIHGVRMGQGEPLLLLHGHPETCLMWHKVAPQLAERFTVVATDLRGYGDSGKPEGLPDHSNYSKRTMAEDQIEVMRALGFERFHVMGHDRGARVAYRMALDEEDLRAGRKIRAETLVLWGANGLVERFFRPLECWAKFGDHIQGHNLPCGHFIPEEAPLPMLEAVENFL